MTSSARRPGTSSWPATRPMRPSTTPGRPSTRARGWPTKPCWTMCSGRWRCSSATPEAGTRLLRWRLLEVREATLDIQGDRVAQRADIEAMAELAEALDDDRRRAHAAWRRSALAQRTRGLRRDGGRRAAGRRMGGSGRATPSFDCSRSGCWRCRSPSRAGPPKVGLIARRDPGRGARAGAAPGRGFVPECTRRDRRDAERRRRRAAVGPAIARRLSGSRRPAQRGHRARQHRRRLAGAR